MTKKGRPIIHGGYSVRPPRELISGRGGKRLRLYVNRIRGQIAEDLGGEDRMTGGQLLVLDRVTSKLLLIRLIELYITEAGPWEKPGTLRPVLAGPYLAFSRSLLDDLRLLGIERREAEERYLKPWELKDDDETIEGSKPEEVKT